MAGVPASIGNMINIKTDKRLTLVGIRIVGLCILAYSIVALGNSAISAAMNSYVVSHPNTVGGTIAPNSGLPEDEIDDLDSQFRMERSFQVAAHRISLRQDISRIVWAGAVFLVGLYMCRGGQWFMVFLNAVDAEPAVPRDGQ